MERKYWNFETAIEHLKDRLREMLHGYHIYYKLSSAGNAWHFKILCTEEEARVVDDFIARYFEHESLTLQA